MKIHHLNCGSLVEVPPAPSDDMLAPAPAVCHCLLLETDDAGLVLVDCGLGTDDVKRPRDSLSEGWMELTAPALDLGETAIEQVRSLGLEPDDVRHVVLTHLDVDHAGGLPDFPDATVHVHDAELAAALAEAVRGATTPGRYRAAHWAHGPRWATYSAADGDAWFGFDAVRKLDGLPPEILLVPLAGHTRGHCAVAVDRGDKWIVHAGDAFFYHGEIDPDRPRTNAVADIMNESTETERSLRLGNLARIRELVRYHADDVDVFNAHDPWDLARLTSAATGARAAR